MSRGLRTPMDGGMDKTGAVLLVTVIPLIDVALWARDKFQDRATSARQA